MFRIKHKDHGFMDVYSEKDLDQHKALGWVIDDGLALKEKLSKNNIEMTNTEKVDEQVVVKRAYNRRV